VLAVVPWSAAMAAEKHRDQLESLAGSFIFSVIGAAGAPRFVLQFLALPLFFGGKS
jgi:hypothetical protein